MCGLCSKAGLLPLHQPCHHVGDLTLFLFLEAHLICSTPETFDIVSTTVDIASRKNLAQISRMLTQITSGSEFSEEQLAYLPVNDYVRKTITSITAWLLEGQLTLLNAVHSLLTPCSGKCVRC